MSETKSYANRIWILEILKTVSAISVVVKHTIVTWLTYYPIGSIYWWITNIVESFTRRSVPLFLMITGILILKPSKFDENYMDFYRKRILSVLVPFIFAVGLYVFGDIVILWTPILNYHEFIKSILNIWYYYHLWYVVLILAVYMIIPFIRVILKNADDRLLRIYMYFWIGFKFINIVLVQYLWWAWAWTPSWFLGLEWYVILWYMIWYKWFIVEYLWKYKIIWLYLIAACFTALWVYTSSLEVWTLSDQFFHPNMPNIMIMSICVMWIWYHFKDLTLSKNVLEKLRVFSKTRFGLYIIHPVFIFLFTILFNKLWISFWYNLILTSIASIITSWFVVWVMQKFKWGRVIYPEA